MDNITLEKITYKKFVNKIDNISKKSEKNINDVLNEISNVKDYLMEEKLWD